MSRLPVFWLGLTLLVLVALGGCASRDTEGGNAGMNVEVNFADVHKCSRISPEIVVYNPPAGTRYYEVRVSVVGTSPEKFFSGGRWPYGGLNADGADVIPEGGLVNTYKAPCLSPGQSSKTYRFTVYARANNTSAPLGIAAASVTLEP